jgi:hypothetical protein
MADDQYSFSFADAPLSVTEVRAEKQDDPAIWTCRDILIKMLRDIDSGKANPNIMVICYATIHDGNTKASFLNKSASVYESIGLLSEVKHMILEED